MRGERAWLLFGAFLNGADRGSAFGQERFNFLAELWLLTQAVGIVDLRLGADAAFLVNKHDLRHGKTLGAGVLEIVQHALARGETHREVGAVGAYEIAHRGRVGVIEGYRQRLKPSGPIFAVQLGDQLAQRLAVRAGSEDE